MSALATECEKINSRLSNLKDRVDAAFDGLNSLEKIVDGQTSKRAFLSFPPLQGYKVDDNQDQQLLVPSSRPVAIQETYETCQKIPELEKLDVYRDDKLQSAKLY